MIFADNKLSDCVCNGIVEGALCEEIEISGFFAFL